MKSMIFLSVVTSASWVGWSIDTAAEKDVEEGPLLPLLTNRLALLPLAAHHLLRPLPLRGLQPSNLEYACHERAVNLDDALL
jgi:hypothetical protein